MNPYWGADFFNFFALALQRLFSGAPLVSDEVQMIALSLVAISCALVGPFLVLKKMAMFANSLSHTILLGIAAAYLLTSKMWGGSFFDLSTLLIGAFLAALASAFFTEGLVKWFRLQEDASVGLVFTALFALGIVVVTVFTKDVHLGVEAVMGNADALQASDLRTGLVLAGMNLAVITLFYRQFQVASFDASFAKALGVRSFRFVLLFLVAATCIGAFRSVGVLLVLSFLVGPYLTARMFCDRLPQLLFWSAFLGVAASVIGVALSRHVLTVYALPLSTGGLVSVVIGLFYVIGILVKMRRKTMVTI